MRISVPLKQIGHVSVGPGDLVIFIDETGGEHYGDPHFPIFGFGGCAALGEDYEDLIQKPWRRLKRAKFGGANKRFHASELGRLRAGQIGALNRFMLRPFHRLGIVSDDQSIRSESIDGHRSMVIGLHRIIGAMTKKHPLDRVAIVFEQSERGTPLVYRDFEWLKRGFYDSRGKRVQGDFCFAPKDAMEPGLELADLIAHTVGRQQRCWRKDWGKMEKDFEAVFHSVDKSLCEFMAVAETKITQLTMPAGEVEAFLRSLD